MIGLYHYQILYELLLEINLIYKEEELAHHVLQKITKAFDAEGGAIYVIRDDENLLPLASYGLDADKLKKIPFQVGIGLVGWVAKTRQCIRMGLPRQDPRFSRIDNGQNGFAICNMLAAPIMFGNKLEGVIQFVNKRGTVFGVGDEELLYFLGRVVGSALEKTRGHKELETSQILQQAVINSLSAGMIVTDIDSHLLLFNSRAQEILRGLPQLKRGWDIAQWKPWLADIVDSLHRVIRERQPALRQENRSSWQGQEKILGYSCVPVISAQNQLLGTSLLLQDITHLGQTRSINPESKKPQAPSGYQDTATMATIISSLASVPIDFL